MPDDTPSTPAAPAAAAVAPIPATAAAQTVTIPLEQLQTFTSMQARLVQLEAEQRTRDEAAKAEQVKLLAQKGEIENALRIQREQADQQLASERSAKLAIEERARRYALDGELSRVLASQPLVPGGADQLTQLWRSQFNVEVQGDSFTVRTPTFQSVGEFISQQLAKPEYAHFIRAANPGGGTAGTSGGGLSAPTAPANASPEPQPKTLSEAVILTMQTMAKKGVADPRLDPAAGFGLRPTARSG
jgi:hypothetical protein